MLLAKHRDSAILATRVMQLLCMALVVVGILWASTDLLMVTVLVESPVTPMSLLFILYGFIGSTLTELLARCLARSNNSSEKK